jgi:phage/plasmid-like protein (TIGR03299 family)
MGRTQDVPGKFAVIRSDIDVPLGIVGKRYETISNAESLSILDGLMHEGCKVTHAGFYGHGQTVWASLDLGDFTVRGDTHRRKMRVSTSHDGTGSLKFSMHVWRLICKNGLMGWGKEEQVSIRHTRSYKDNIRQARHILGVADQYHIWFQEQLNKLTTVRCLSPRPLAEKWFNVESTKGQNAIAQVEYLYRYGKGNVGRTMYDLYNGLTEYVDHYKETGRNAEKREVSNLSGAGKKLKVQALKDILEAIK